MTTALRCVLVVALVGGCAVGGPPSSPDSPPLLVFAAASLAPVTDRLAAAYGATGPGRRVTIATDSSAALRTQIELGAPADVFLSADVDHPAALVEAGLADEIVPYATNALAVIVPLDNPGGLRTAADLAKPGIRIVAAGERVPISRYARLLLERLAAIDGGPAGLVEGYDTNVATREDNVRAVVAKIELGEGDAAIVYATDARGSSRVRELPIPVGARVSGTYGGVVLHAGDVVAAQAFLAWLVGPQGQAILRGAGFSPPP